MRVAARDSPTRVATAIVSTRPPIMRGIHISVPVRAVVEPAVVELELELEFEFEFEFELELEFEFD